MKTQLLVNGRFYTLKAEGDVVDGLVVENGLIKAVGKPEELREAHPEAEVLDVGGRAVVPGLTDSHLHLMSYGRMLTQLDLAGVRSLAELKRLVADRARQAKSSEWVLGRGWDQDRFAEKRYPTRWDLDQVAPDVPVLLRRACGHAAVANSLALERAGLHPGVGDPPGGRFDRDPETGELTGVMRERATAAVQKVVPPPSRQVRKAALHAAIKRAHQAGLVAVHANDIGEPDELADTWDLYNEVIGDGDGQLPFRLYLDTGIDALQAAIDMGFVTGSGNDYLRFGSMKLFADGSLGASTAALYEDYADEPGNRGILVKTEEELHDEIMRSHRAGMQVAIHVIGDRAAGVSLDGIEAALEAEPRADHRHRLIHCQILTSGLLRKMSHLGVVADVQPKFITTDMLWAGQRVGRERVTTTYAWRSLLEAGVPLAFGSDAPVEPLEPALGLYAAVTRRNMEGDPPGGWLPEQKLSVYESMRAFTVGGAYAEFEENKRGTLEPGKRADLVVLNADPFRVEPAALKNLAPVLTMIGGHTVYSTF